MILKNILCINVKCVNPNKDYELLFLYKWSFIERFLNENLIHLYFLIHLTQTEFLMITKKYINDEWNHIK